MACLQHMLMRQDPASKLVQVKAPSTVMLEAYQQGHKAAAVENVVVDVQRIVVGISTCTLGRSAHSHAA